MSFDFDIDINLTRETAVILVILIVLQAPAAVALVGPSHSASAGVVYQTNSGLSVELGDPRRIAAAPFDGPDTFASDGVRLSSADGGSATINNNTFDGPDMTVRAIDAGAEPITLNRDDIANPVRVQDSVTSITIGNVTLDDGQTDISLQASSETTIVVEGVQDVDGIQAVDAAGTPLAGDTDTDGNSATLTVPAGSFDLQLQNGPSRLEIRDLKTQDLVKNASSPITVTVEFFGNEGTVEQRTTTNGVVNMTGLPADERFSVSLSNQDEFVQRQILITSLIDEQEAFLLPQDPSIDTVEPRFILEDPSNQFNTERSEIVLKRPIQRNGSTQFVSVAGDRVGLNGFDTILERDQRYKLSVTDPTSGATRELGAFTPSQSEEVILTVEDVEFDSVADVDELAWNAEYVTLENSADRIEFILRDDFVTQSLQYEIYEQGNESNVLVSDSVKGNVTINATVPPGEQDKVYVVEFELTRANGEVVSASRPVSSDSLPVGPPGLPDRWQAIIAMLFLMAIGGLFGAANPGIGGIAVAGSGAMFYFIGWLPDATGGLAVALALMLGALSYTARRARGANA